MEVKVQCACGTKYKFEVEPVNTRMPAPVSCPACGADGTEQANEFLRASLSAQVPRAAGPPPVARVVSSPLRPSVSDSQQPPIPPPIGLPGAGGAYAAAPPPPIAGVRVVPAPPPAKSKGVLVGTVVAVLFLAFMGFGTWKVCHKWFKRFELMADIASAIKKSSTSNELPKQNLAYEDCVVLFIKHTNHVEIAEACRDYWKDKLGRQLTVSESSEPSGAEGQYQLIPAHNGYVRLIGTLDWPASQFERLSLHLSQNFNTLVFEVQDVDFSGAYHFGVYNQGVRKFHAQMDVKITQTEADETVTTEGNEWAVANGYKPGPDGFKEFDLSDADAITQRLGMKLWDEPEGAEPKVLVLKE